MRLTSLALLVTRDEHQAVPELMEIVMNRRRGCKKYGEEHNAHDSEQNHSLGHYGEVQGLGQPNVLAGLFIYGSHAFLL